MPKKNQKDHREKIGRFYNEVQEANNQIQDARSTQQRLNNIADNVGHQPTTGNSSKLHAMVHALSLLGTLRPSLERPQQNRVQEPVANSTNVVRQKRHQPTIPPLTPNTVTASLSTMQAVPLQKRKRAKKPVTSTSKQFTDLRDKATTIAKSQTTTALPISASDLVLEQVKKINEDIMNNQVPVNRYPEPLPVFYYDHELFQKRDKTSGVNKEIKAFFIKEGLMDHSATDSKLVETAEKWIESLSLNEADGSEKAGFLSYKLLQAYGIEDVRLGDFISTVKLQNILMQWKVNTFLETYKYNEIPHEKNPHILSFPEHDSIIEFEKYKKESEQLFRGFIHDMPSTIPKNQPLDLLFYKYDLWEAREKTKRVNGKVEQFLKKHNVSLNEPSPSELVRKMQEWVLAGETYNGIKEREIRAADLIRKEYGIKTTTESVGEARLYLLQWENNNAQSGYTYKKLQDFDEMKIGEGKTDKGPFGENELESKISAFIQENDFGNTENSISESLPSKMDKTQQESQRKAAIAFLTEKGIASDISDSQQLVEAVVSWIDNELKTTEIPSLARMKQFANLLLGKKEDEVISAETAGEIVTSWVMDANENNNSSLNTTDIEEQMQGDMPSNSLLASLTERKSQWRDPKVMRAVGELLLQKKGLSQSPDKEILSAVGKWFRQEDGRVVISSDKAQPLAKVILKEVKLYGGEPEESISNEDAVKTVMKWTFENVLNKSIEEYITQKILVAPDPFKFKISDLREELEQVANAYLPLEPHDHDYAFKAAWTKFLEKALPNYLYKSNILAKDPLVSDYEMLTQLTGEKLLENVEYRETLSQSEVRTLGAYFLDTMSKKEKYSPEELQQLLFPALLATAQLEPELLRKAFENGNYQEVALNTFTSYYRKGYFKVIKDQEALQPLLAAYQRATLDWRRKGKLAGTVVEECHKRGVPMFFLLGPRIIPGVPIPLGMVIGENAYDAYLKGLHPCPTLDWTPPNLEQWYTHLTKAVADTYQPLDKKLIELALEKLEPKDSEFIFSPETQIYKASAKLKLKKKEETPPHIYAPRRIKPFGSFPKTNWDLEKTDLFVAKRGNEERIYALKKLGNETGYEVYNVDRRLAAYLKYELFSVDESVKVVRPLDPRDFDLSIDVDQNSRKQSDKTYHQHLASEFSLKHRDKLYEQLYESGNDKTVAEQTFDIVKHFIPFYDCVTESINGNAGEAVPACLIDIVSLIPVAGQAIGLSTKFGVGVSKALLRGGLRNALKNSRYFLPKSAELTKLGISTLQYLDPGFELIADGGRLAVKGLTKLKKESASGLERLVLDKLEKLEKETVPVAASFKRASLLEDGPEVNVKLTRDRLYVQVTDVEKGDGFGPYLVLKGNQLERLEVFKGAPHFSKKQKKKQMKLLDQLAVHEMDFDQFKDAVNLYPKAYGEGEIRMGIIKGETNTQHFIRMNNRWIPVRETVIEGQGVRYDVCSGKKVLPVNFNGVEWHFEESTSPFVAKTVLRKVSSEFKQFEMLKDPHVLSAPDEKGLMRDASGKTYIKINDHYVSLVSLDKEANLYQLVRKGGHDPMTVLRFDPESGRFRMETPREKELREAGHDPREKGASKSKKERCEKDLSSLEAMVFCGGATSRSRQSELWNSVSRKSYRKKIKGGITYNILPESPSKGEEWNAIRKAKPYKPEYVRDEDPRVALPKLTEFIPEEPILIEPDDKKIRKWILEGIKKNFVDLSQSKHDFQVVTGLDPSKAPEFIRSFQKEVADGLREAEEIFSRAKNKYQHLLKQSDIAATDVGRYWTKMFILKDSPDKEEILKEVAKRMLSRSEKGEEFLQKTKEFGFENIWIVSSEFELDPQTKVYQSKMEKKGKVARAFVIPADPECRIMILADAFCRNPALAPTLQMKGNLGETIVHEVTHLVSGTKDLAAYHLPEKGFRMNGKETRDRYFREIQKIIDTQDFQEFVDQLAATSQSLDKLSAGNVFAALRYDDMLQANLQMTDAEMVTIIMRDNAEGRTFKEELRIKRSLDTKIPDKTRISESLGDKREKRSLSSAVQMGEEKSRSMKKQKIDLSPVRKKEEMMLQF